MKKLVKWSDVVLFFTGWKFSDWFIYGLTIFVSMAIGYVVGVN